MERKKVMMIAVIFQSRFYENVFDCDQGFPGAFPGTYCLWLAKPQFNQMNIFVKEMKFSLKTRFNCQHLYVSKTNPLFFAINRLCEHKHTETVQIHFTHDLF